MNFPFIWCKNVGRTFVRFVTIHACDGRTDGQTDGRTDGQMLIIKTALHTMQRGKNWSKWDVFLNVLYIAVQWLIKFYVILFAVYFGSVLTLKNTPLVTTLHASVHSSFAIRIYSICSVCLIDLTRNYFF